MYVSVIFYDQEAKAYVGKEYTYKVDDDLPITEFTKVLAPTPKGIKKALVTRINVPDSEISPAWANKIKEIKEMDNEGFEKA